MELNVKKLLSAGKISGAFEFDYDAPADLCVIPLCKIDGKVKVAGDYEIYDDDAVGVRFTVTYNLSGQCSYCLSDAKKRITFQSDVMFVPEKDEENYFYDGYKINLKTAVDDAILISQPNILLCKPDCKGIDVT